MGVQGAMGWGSKVGGVWFLGAIRYKDVAKTC